MNDLEQLLDIPGVMAAFAFNERGELRQHCIAPGPETELDPSILDMVGHMCVANAAIAAMQARGWEYLTGAQGFYPIEGVSLVCLKWSVVSRGHVGMILNNRLANYEMAFAALAVRSAP